MGGSPVPPAGLDDALHSMEEAGEPSPLFFGTHSTNHKIRWNQGNSNGLLAPPAGSAPAGRPPHPGLVRATPYVGWCWTGVLGWGRVALQGCSSRLHQSPPQPQRRRLPITPAAQGQPPPSGGQRWLRQAAATGRWCAGGDLSRWRGGDKVGVRTRWQRPFPSRRPPRAAPAALAARPPSWPCPAARAGGLLAPDRAGPPRGWAPPGPPWQGLRQAGSVGRVGRPQAWAPAGAGWQGVGGRGRVGLREKWLCFSYTPLHNLRVRLTPWQPMV
jgi:hypothetical protein